MPYASDRVFSGVPWKRTQTTGPVTIRGGAAFRAKRKWAGVMIAAISLLVMQHPPAHSLLPPMSS